MNPKKFSLIAGLIVILILIAGAFIILKPSTPSPNQLNSTQVFATPSPIPLPTPENDPKRQSNGPARATPTPDKNTYACDPQGVCNAYKNPKSANCPVYFKDSYCNNECANPDNRCQQ